MRRAQSAYDLLPPDPARSPPADRPLVAAAGSGRRIAISPLVERSWMPPGPEGDAMRSRAEDAAARLGDRGRQIVLRGGLPHPPIVNLVGWGIPTESWAEIAADGQVTIHRDRDGDGTTSRWSAGWLGGSGVRTFFLPLGIDAAARIPLRHARIWDSAPVVDVLAEALRDAAPEPFVAAAVEGRDERRGAVRTLRVSAQAADGSPLPAARLLLRPPLRDVGPLPLAGATHRDFDLPTQGLRPNLPDGTLRFVVEVAWGGGGPEERRELPLAMHL